jgi:hypothetical protein
MSYVHNLIVSIDQLLNTICGGDPDNTISARVGYFSNIRKWKAPTKKLIKWYWKTTEKIINCTYMPAEGSGHCLDAYKADPEEAYDDNNCWPALFFMSLIIISICIPVGGILYVLRELGFKRFNKGIAKLSKENTLLNRKTRFIKWIKKFFLIIIALIIVPVFFVVVAGLLIIIINVALIIIIPVGTLIGGICYLLRKLVFKSLIKVESSRSKNNISVKAEIRLIRGVIKFKKVLNKYCIKGISESDRAIIIMDIFHKIFGYQKYSEITSKYKNINNSHVLTVKIESIPDKNDNKREFLIEVYPIEADLKIASDIQVADYEPDKSADRVILTNGIDWKVFTINREQAPTKFVRFNFLHLDPAKTKDIDILYDLSKESFGLTVPEDQIAEADNK